MKYKYPKFITIILWLIAIVTVSMPILSVCSFAIGLVIYIISELKERIKNEIF